jgi:branched-chain amino acid transport system substrate-binding protein
MFTTRRKKRPGISRFGLYPERCLRAVAFVGIALSVTALASIPTSVASAAPAKKVHHAKRPSGAPVVFRAIVSETGGAAALGKTEALALKDLAKQTNSTGGIDGHPMKVTIKNNATSPSTAVSEASPWVKANVPFILNGSITATDRAVDALATSKGPFIYDLSPGDHPKAKTFWFSAGISTRSDAHAYLTYFKAKHLTKIGIITGTTSSGADGFAQFTKALKTPKFSGMTMTNHQTFTPTAVSVTTQMSAIKASNPQVLVIWVTGTPVGTVFKAMSSLGMETIPTVTTDGNASYTLLTHLGSVVPKHLFFPLGALYMPPKVIKNPAVRKVVTTFDKVVKAAGGHGGDPWGLAYTPGLRLVGAMKKLGVHATAKQILHYMEHLHKVAGIYGQITTTPSNHRGIITSDVYMGEWSGHGFTPVGGPGGVPLK